MVPADIRCVAAAALRVRVLAPVQRAGRCFGWLSTCASCAAPAAGMTEMKHFAGSKAAVHPGCDRAGKYIFAHYCCDMPPCQCTNVLLVG